MPMMSTPVALAAKLVDVILQHRRGEMPVRGIYPRDRCRVKSRDGKRSPMEASDVQCGGRACKTTSSPGAGR